MSDDPSVYDDEIDLKAASYRLLSIALQSEFDKLLEAEGPNAPNAIARALRNISRAGRPSKETT